MWIIPSLLGSSLLHYESEDQWERLSAWVYGAGLSSLFIISTLFHTVAWKKSHLRYENTLKKPCKSIPSNFYMFINLKPQTSLYLGFYVTHLYQILHDYEAEGKQYMMLFSKVFIYVFSSLNINNPL